MITTSSMIASDVIAVIFTVINLLESNLASTIASHAKSESNPAIDASNLINMN